MKFFTYSFERLEVWQLGRKIRIRVYSLCKQLPIEEQFGIISQMKRASNSITSNLAEGSGRKTSRDKAHFVRMAITSTLEVLDQIIASYDLEYISEAQYIEMRVALDHLINKLNSFLNYQLKKP